MKRILTALVLLSMLPSSGQTQERIKFPVGVSSKILGYGHLWAAWRLKYFEREGLDAEVVLMRGTAPGVQALIAGSIFAGLLANDGPIAAVEQGMDIAMIAGSSKLTHILLGAKNYKTWEDLRGATIGASTLTSGTAFVLRRALKIKGLEYPRDYQLLNVGGTATAARVTEAFKIILADQNVKGVLVNIFGGIVRCDLIADGIIAAVKDVGVKVPVVVRLAGNNADLGSRKLTDSGLNIIPADGLTDAAQKVVKAVESVA